MRDDLGSTNIIIKRLSISSALPPSESDELYDEKENEAMSTPSSYPYSVDDDGDEGDGFNPSSYDADNEKDRRPDSPGGKYIRSVRLRDEFDPSTASSVIPSSPSFVFHGSRDRGDGGRGQAQSEKDGHSVNRNVNGNVNRGINGENDDSSDSDCSYMLPCARGLVTSKLVRGRNPATHVDLLIDDVIKKSARRSTGESFDIIVAILFIICTVN